MAERVEREGAEEVVGENVLLLGTKAASAQPRSLYHTAVLALLALSALSALLGSLLLLWPLLRSREAEWVAPLVSLVVPLPPPLQSDARGFVAVMYSGSPRAFSRVFRSHLVNLFASSPYTMHVFVHTFATEFRAANAHDRRYWSINDTLSYFDAYTNVDGQRVQLMTDCLQGFELDHSSLEDIRRTYAAQLAFALQSGAWEYGSPGFEAATLLGMLHSQSKANDLRHAYSQRTGVEYRWVLRMRMDVILRSNVWDSVFDRDVFDPLLAEHAALLQLGQRPFEHAESPVLLHDVVYRAHIPSHVVLLPNGSHGSLPHGWNDQWALMNSTAHDVYTSRVQLQVIAALYQTAGDFVWAAETSLRRVLEHSSVPVQQSDRFCYSIVRTLPQVERGETGGVAAVLPPAAFVQRSSCSLSTQFGPEWYGVDVCHAVCGAVRAREAHTTAAIQRRLSAAAAAAMAAINDTQAADSLPPRLLQALSAFVPSFPGRAHLSWAAAFRAYAQLEREGQPPSLPEALLPLYLQAQGGEHPSLSASNYALYYAAFHADVRVACEYEEAGTVVGALAVDPYHFHRFPFLGTSPDPQVVDRYMQTSTCWTAQSEHSTVPDGK